MKFSTISSIALVLSTAKTVVAAPPACLLACVAQVTRQSDCSGLNDLSCICSSEYSNVEECLNDICPEGASDGAISSFEDTCSPYGHSSSSSESSSSESSSSAVTSESSSSVVTSESSSSAVTSSEVTSSEAATSEVTSATSSTEVSSVPATSATVEAVSTTEATSSEVSSAAPTTLAAVSTSSEAPVVSTQSENFANAKSVSLAVIGLMVAALV